LLHCILEGSWNIQFKTPTILQNEMKRHLTAQAIFPSSKYPDYVEGIGIILPQLFRLSLNFDLSKELIPFFSRNAVQIQNVIHGGHQIWMAGSSPAMVSFIDQRAARGVLRREQERRAMCTTST